MRYEVRHLTRFRYAGAVRFARCNLRLRPVDWPGQALEDFTLSVEPAGTVGVTRRGGYPVNVTRVTVERPVRELAIESRFRVMVDRVTPEVRADDATIAALREARASRDPSATGPANYLPPSPLIALTPAIRDWCAVELAGDRGIVEAGLALAKAIKRDFRYDGSATTAETTPADAFAARHGVCQDFAQVMIAGCRALGLPAAYVSGYLRTNPPPGRPRLVGADASHAWVALWCGETRGWLGFDPTNGCGVGGDHVVAAVGRDYHDVAPIDGVFLGRDSQGVEVAVDVLPLDEGVRAVG